MHCVVHKNVEITPHFLIERKMSSGTIEVRDLASMDEVNALSDWYCIDDPISKAYGLTSKEWRIMGEAWLKRCIGNGLSLVAYCDGELVGGMISEYTTEAPPDIPKEARMDIIMTCLGELDVHLTSVYPQETKMCRVLMATTKPEMRHRGVLKALGIAGLRRRPAVPIVVSTSSEYSRKTCVWSGLKLVHEIKYADWVQDGKKPLAAIASETPHKSMCLFVLGTGMATILSGACTVASAMGII